MRNDPDDDDYDDDMPADYPDCPTGAVVTKELR